MEIEEYSFVKIGAFIRKRRQQLKVTQKDLAMTSNTGLRFISDIEKGKPTCQIGKVLTILQTLGIKIELSVSDAK